MLNEFKEIVGITGYAVEAVGVIIIIVGFILATVQAAGRYSSTPRDDLFQDYRRRIGQAMMLGLEFLVAGDIIRTVVIDHTIADVASLALVVAVRTVLVFTIHLEVEGRWPWQPAPIQTAPASRTSSQTDSQV